MNLFPRNFVKRVCTPGFIRSVLLGSSFSGYYQQVDIACVLEYLKPFSGVVKELMPTDSMSQTNSNIPDNEYNEPEENTSVSLQVIFEVARKLIEKN